jgi:hypothetical protein
MKICPVGRLVYEVGGLCPRRVCPCKFYQAFVLFTAWRMVLGKN